MTRSDPNPDPAPEPARRAAEGPHAPAPASPRGGLLRRLWRWWSYYNPYPRFTLAMVLISPLLIVLSLTALPSGRALAWSVANFWQTHRLLCLIGVLAGVFLLHTIGRAWVLRRQGGGGGVRPFEPRSLSASFVVSLFSLPSVLMLGVVDNTIAAYLAGAQPTVREFYRNHDGAALAGRTVRMVLLREREGITNQADRRALAAVAAILPEAWVELATATTTDEAGNVVSDEAALALIGGEGSVDEPLLSAFLFDRSRPAMDPARWGAVLDHLCSARGVAPLSGDVRERALQRLSDTFGLSLREALKHAWKTGDKAWPALIIDMQTEAVERIRDAIDEQSAEWRAEFAALSDGMRSLRAELATMSEAQRDNHQQVIARLDRMERKVDEIFRMVALLLEDRHRVQTEGLIVSTSGGVRTPQITPELAESIRRLLAFGDPVDQAMASIASVSRPYTEATWTQADTFLAQADLWRASGIDWTDDTEYRYQIAHGERRRFDDDPDGAAPYFEAALAIRPGDADATIRLAWVLAQSRVADGGDSKRRALALAEELLTRKEPMSREIRVNALESMATVLLSLGLYTEAEVRIKQALRLEGDGVGRNLFIMARLNLLYAMIEHMLGRSDSARSRTERVKRYYESALDDSDWEYRVVYDQLRIFNRALGDLDKSLEALDRANEIELIYFPENRFKFSLTQYERLRILRNLERYEEALESINRAIEIDNNHFESESWQSANLYAQRAWVLRDMNRFGEALTELDRAIEIDKRRAGDDAPILVTRLADRAMLLRDLERYDEAIVEIDRAIEIEKKHEQTDHPNFADRYEILASILFAMGQANEAIEALHQAVAIYDQHEDTRSFGLSARNDMAGWLYEDGQHRRAIEKQAALVALAEAWFGADHEDTTTYRDTLARWQAERAAQDTGSDED